MERDISLTRCRGWGHAQPATKLRIVGVVVNMPACHVGERQFESGTVRHSLKLTRTVNGCVAQSPYYSVGR